jgi:hypothetical protein
VQSKSDWKELVVGEKREKRRKNKAKHNNNKQQNGTRPMEAFAGNNTANQPVVLFVEDVLDFRWNNVR